MATFHGSINGQAVAGETVTITVTHPDGTKDTLITQTLADNTFSISKPYDIAGTYTAQAHMDKDAKFTAWDSSIESFTISLTTRTGIFGVTLS